MAAEYRFLDTWLVPAPVQDVYDVLGDVLAYPSWWGDVYLEADGDAGPPRPGMRNRVVARGFLPYRLRFTFECVEAEPPHRLVSVATGDFEGSAAWRFAPAGHVTQAVLDWRPRVEKPVVRALTPVLRPLFRANHNWTMRRGQRAIVPYIGRRSSARQSR